MRLLSTTSLAVSLVIAVAAPTLAATYDSVTFTVPVTIDLFPANANGNTSVQCNQVNDNNGFMAIVARTFIPMQKDKNGYTFYHGPPIAVQYKLGANPNAPTLVSGMHLGCSLVVPLTNEQLDNAKTNLQTSFVTLP